MTRFLRERGWRTIAFSRQGYLGTALTDDNRTPDAQAALAAAVMDALTIEQFALMCWSGGGPSSYRLAATAPDRVTSLVAIAAVSSPFKFEGAGEEKMLLGRFGAWLMKELVRHAPKDTVTSLVKQEGELDKDERKKLVKAIWDGAGKRQFARDLMETIDGDRRQAPADTCSRPRSRPWNWSRSFPKPRAVDLLRRPRGAQSGRRRKSGARRLELRQASSLWTSIEYVPTSSTVGSFASIGRSAPTPRPTCVRLSGGMRSARRA
jgi:pimeloyl-ACP methyl ester carboxylesterase